MISKKLVDLAKALQHAYAQDIPDEVPSNYWSITDYEEIKKVSKTTATRSVRKMLKNKIIEKKVFKIMTGRGIYPVPHYKCIK